MKNQYFGDVNDYRKYGLLRHLNRSGFERLMVAWMLTPDDDSAEGNFRSYLTDRARFAGCDPELYVALQAILRNTDPCVALLNDSRVLSTAAFYSAQVPDRRAERLGWQQGLWAAAVGSDLVFVDPDNGIEVKSRPIGRKGSSKYVAWEELTGLWRAGCSVLIYQHFRREERGVFARRMATELAERTGAQLVEAFRTPHVLFLLAAQNRHADAFHRACSVDSSWTGQICAMGFANMPLRPASGADLPGSSNSAVSAVCR